MERVSGWYKRRAQLLLFFIGLAVAIVVNADAIRTADQLWKDDGVRSALVAQVGTQEPNPAADTVLNKLDDLGFPIGWGANSGPNLEETDSLVPSPGKREVPMAPLGERY